MNASYLNFRDSLTIGELARFRKDYHETSSTFYAVGNKLHKEDYDKIKSIMWVENLPQYALLNNKTFLFHCYGVDVYEK